MFDQDLLPELLTASVDDSFVFPLRHLSDLAEERERIKTKQEEQREDTKQ